MVRGHESSGGASSRRRFEFLVGRAPRCVEAVVPVWGVSSFGFQTVVMFDPWRECVHMQGYGVDVQGGLPTVNPPMFDANISQMPRQEIIVVQP